VSIALVERASALTIVVERPALWRCEACGRTWHYPSAPAECGFCATKESRAADAELLYVKAVEAVSPRAVDDVVRHDAARRPSVERGPAAITPPVKKRRRCRACGRLGHRSITCRAPLGLGRDPVIASSPSESDPAKERRACGLCWKYGHNRRKCPDRKTRAPQMIL
jgi:hypothetical protein